MEGALFDGVRGAEKRLNVVSGVMKMRNTIENAFAMLTTIIWFLKPSVLCDR